MPVLAAEDELKIMQLLGNEISEDEVALISAGENPAKKQHKKDVGFSGKISGNPQKKKGISRNFSR